MLEKWMPAYGFHSYYEVSNLGNVRRIQAAMGTRTGKILKPWKYSDGRLAVTLSVKSVTTKIVLSRLVCLSWHGDPPTATYQAAHWDGDTKNNSAQNLRWATQAENEQDKKRHGRWNHAPRGSRNFSAKLKEKDIPRIRMLKKRGLSYAKIGARYRVNWSTIRQVIKGRSWKHV